MVSWGELSSKPQLLFSMDISMSLMRAIVLTQVGLFGVG